MKNIFLIGMPSSGKSTLGKRLARQLNYRFVDTDKLITRKEGRSINDIFRSDGEAYFREVESRILRTIQAGKGLVIATGGGMPCFHANMDYIKSTGVSVFLDVPPERLVERMLVHAVNDRPLYNQADPALLENLRLKYDTRLPIYARADITLSGDITIDALLDRLAVYI